MRNRLKKTDVFIILMLVVVFSAALATNTRLIRISMKEQTEKVGQTQISSIKKDFENYIVGAENALLRVVSGAEQLQAELDGRAALEDYIVEQKKMQIDASDGVRFNVYIAGQGWHIIPDFDAPADYHATDRNWYVGAIDSQGETYITEPYIDSMTGKMCYTMSVMLEDGETVVAMDFTLSEIQESIKKMALQDRSRALITTSDGLIVGYTDMSLAGQNLKDVLPEYQSILEDILDNAGEKSFQTTVNGSKSTIFYSVTRNNWYMILSVDDSQLYRTSTRRVLFTILINVLMLVAIVILYSRSVRNRIRAEKVREEREVFTEKLLNNLKEPIEKIAASEMETDELDSHTREKLSVIKEAGLRIDEVVKNLSSYSSIASDLEQEKEAKKKNARAQFRHIRVFRNIIVSLLIILMMVSSYFIYDSGRDTIEDMMYLSRNYYNYKLEEWEQEHMTILSMFTDVIAAEPEIMDDYDRAVAWLDDIAKKYKSISVCYLANPHSEHTVIMNNGWQPEDGWKVEEREWYRETEKSLDGYSISSPYYDDQTGNYCITISKIVYGKKGEFLGIFGIDLYMDKLIDIFGEKYRDDSEYVFLVDSNGDIINHPNPAYQMSESVKMNVKDTPYQTAYNSSKESPVTFTDFDGVKRCCITSRDKSTGFTVMLVWDWTNVYLYQILYVVICAVFILVVIIVIIFLLNKVIRSQTAMNRKLAVAVDEATRAGNAKSEFLAQMSHEIRTPINAVIGMDEMILRETEDPGIREYAEDIRSASNTLLTLVNGVLDFSKIESGKMEIVPARYDTKGMIDELMNIISERAGNKGLEFRTEIDPALPTALYGDDVRLKQVITNLLSNAVKYTEKGSITLIVRATEQSEEECTLCVEVKDTGIGIREEDKEKLFRSFQRLDEKRNRTIEGTGLGLSIVDGILRLMDSSLQVESTYGKGSCFSFQVKQKVIDPTPIGDYQRHRETNITEEKGKRLIIHGANILVVDDNEMNLKVVRRLMKRLSVTPDLAESGREAIRMVKKKSYDIILMDHMMPEMDGIETYRKMLEYKLIGEDAVVIALTANAITGARDKYIAEGFRDYISKPIDPEVLETMLEKYLPEGSCSRVEATEEEQKSEERKESGDTDVSAKKKSGKTENTESAAKQSREADAAQDEDGTLFERMERKGVDIQAAKKYCMADESFYLEMLKAFLQVEPEKRAAIETSFAEKNWKAYQIEVHSLKSSARTIGLSDLSALALEQEMAAKGNQVETISAGCGPLLEAFGEAVHMLQEELSRLS